ncbi:response regulator transcription factor [Halorussus sp. MSC15.2]|uniref:response regulator transcription factor n=1 Tax=Halorussus sp. MSC15.2 TaxID=2283638 RepID=UPI0013D75A1B|nr:HalX domain-containing protein [Halorussus sp. MSC15.2]NEU58003.1 response regulator [Halorussus sp. MSC15.2]
MSPDQSTVLVVDDEQDVADLYAMWLENDYRVRSAYEGDAALDVLDESVDVVLLDRRMPGQSGDEVLAEIRDRDLNCRVVMVTAVKPDFDILEMGFDDYLVKPVSKDDLHETVEQMLTRVDYGAKLQQYFSLVSKRAVLESEKDAEALESNDEYAQLETEIESLRTEVDHSRDQLDDHDDFVGAFQDL